MTAQERSPVLFRATSADRKLSPVDFVDVGGDRKRPVPRAPFCSSSYSSIEATCPDLCPWKDGGCFVREGFTGVMSAELDRAALASTGDVVTFLLAQAIDKSFGGKRGTWPRDGGRDGRSPRDHRINNGGDVSSERGARWVAAAALRSQRRGAGSFWGYTHRWREIPLEAFGVMHVLASVESVADAFLAMARGYAPAITLPDFPSERAFTLRGPRTVGPRVEVDAALKIIPCPAETARATTCVEMGDGKAATEEGPRSVSDKNAKVKGRFTIHIDLDMKANGETNVVGTFKRTASKPKPAGRTMWVSKGGNLIEDNPRQQKLPLREVAPPKRRNIDDDEATTGDGGGD